MPNDAQPFAYSVNSYCSLMGISPAKFYREVSDGNIKPVKMGRKTLITRDEVERVLASLASFDEAKPKSSRTKVARHDDHHAPLNAETPPWVRRGSETAFVGVPPTPIKR